MQATLVNLRLAFHATKSLLSFDNDERAQNPKANKKMLFLAFLIKKWLKEK
jgi:hypothetical protein